MLLAAIAVSSLVPGATLAEVSGPPLLSVNGVTLDLIRYVNGEFCTGDHKLVANLTNVGDTSFNHDIRIDAKAIDLEKTFLERTSVNSSAILAPGKTIQIESGTIDFPRGTFDVTISVVYGTTTIEASSTVIVLDVIDLAIQDVSIEPGQRFKMGSSIDIGIDVSFTGNADSWAEDVRAVLRIDNGSGIVSTSEVEVMDNDRKPVDPPFLFRDLSFDTWVPTSPGEYTAMISISYLDDDPENNGVSIPITVFVVPTLQGNVTSNGSPVPDALVVLYRDMIIMWANRTDSMGYFKVFGLGSGTYTLNVSVEFAIPFEMSVRLVAGKTLNVSVGLEFMDKGHLEGYVEVMPGGIPAIDATVTVELIENDAIERNATVFSDDIGYFFFPLLDEGKYSIRARHPGYGDYIGSVMVLPWTTVNVTIRIQIAVFKVVRMVPANETIDFSVEDNLSVEFSRSVDLRTMGNITLMDTQDEVPIPVRYGYSDDRTMITLDPIEDLINMREYILSVLPLMRASNGDPLVKAVRSYFVTREGRYPVTVTSDPEPGETGVLVQENIVVTFSESMDQSTVNTNSFRVLKEGSVQVMGTISMSSGKKVAYFDPNGPLEMSTRYVVELSDSIRPVDSFSVFMGKTFEFTTMVETTPGSVKGRLLDPDGNPITDKETRIDIIGVGNDQTTTVDDDGWFQFEGVAPGTWQIQVQCPGYEMMTRSVEVRPGEVTRVGNLRPNEEAEEDYAGIVCCVAIIVIVVIVTIVVVKVKKGQKGSKAKEETYQRPQVPQWSTPSNVPDMVREEQSFESEDAPIDDAEEGPLLEEVEFRPSIRSVDNTLCIEAMGDSVDSSRLHIEIDGAPLQNVPGTVGPSEEYRVDTGIEIMPGEEYLVSVSLDGSMAFERMVTADP